MWRIIYCRPEVQQGSQTCDTFTFYGPSLASHSHAHTRKHTTHCTGTHNTHAHKSYALHTFTQSPISAAPSSSSSNFVEWLSCCHINRYIWPQEMAGETHRVQMLTLSNSCHGNTATLIVSCSGTYFSTAAEEETWTNVFLHT